MAKIHQMKATILEIVEATILEIVEATQVEMKAVEKHFVCWHLYHQEGVEIAVDAR
jgi:hypothetical protein